MSKLSSLILAVVCLLIGFFAKQLLDQVRELVKKTSIRQETIELQYGPYDFTMKFELVKNRFHSFDILDPDHEIEEEFVSESQFRTVMYGIIGRDLGKGGHQVAYWQKKGILQCNKIRFTLFDTFKLEYVPKLTSDGKMYGFHSSGYRRAVKRGNKLGYLYIRGFIEHADIKAFRELNDKNNDLDYRRFFRCEKFEEIMAASHNPREILEQRTSLKKYSHIDSDGNLQGLIRYWLERPELGLKLVE